MKIAVWHIGKTKFSYVQDGMSHYTKLLDRYCSLELKYLKAASGVTSNNIQTYQKIEATQVMSKLNNSDYLVLLDESGKQFSSVAMSTWLQSAIERSPARIVFLIGGAYGFDSSVYARAQFKLSLSKMTFPHQLVRIVFLEQLYRSFTILNNQPYHH